MSVLVPRRIIRYFFIGSSLLFWLMCCSLTLQGQSSEDSYSFSFRGEPLTNVLEKIASHTETDMVYDPAIVEGISVYTRIEEKSVGEILQEVLEATTLDFVTLSSGTIVIVKNVGDDPSYGTLSGKIVDRSTGKPLPGATVKLADASGGTSTGNSGRFVLSDLISGTYHIVFSYVGYEAVYKTIEIQPDEHKREEISLQPKPVDFKPVVVKEHLPQLPQGNNGKGEIIDSDSEWEKAGPMKDAIQSLSLFSGVQYGIPMTDLHLQGGRQGDHRILLDGVPVYNPYSFGQMFSAFSPYAISKIELHKSGYGPSEGSQIAGLIDLSHDMGGGNNYSGQMQGDPLSLNVRGDMNFTGDNESSSFKVMAAGRSNYWNIYQEPNLAQTLQQWDELDPVMTNILLDSENDASLYEPREHSSNVRFYDVHLASEYEIDDYKTLSSSFYFGENDVSTELLREAPALEEMPRYLYARDQYQWDNFMGQISYNQFVSPRLNLETQLSFSENAFLHHYQLGTSNNPVIPEGGLGTTSDAVFSTFQEASTQNRVPNQRNENNISHFIFRTDGTYSFSPNVKADAGVQVDYVQSEVNLTDLFYLPTISDQRTLLLSSYLDGTWRTGEYWKFSLGSRFTYVDVIDRLYSEPRASVQFDRPDSDIGYWSVRFSGGYYRQFIHQFEITNPGPTSLVPSFKVWSHGKLSQTPEAWHLGSSFYYEPAENTTFNIEAFYKWQPTTYTVSYQNLLRDMAVDRTSANAFAETTQMENAGFSFRLDQSAFDSKIKLMLGYDYNYNRINLDSQFGRSLPASWHEPHRFQLRGLWHLWPELSVVAKWQSILGRSWGFRQAYYHFLFYADNQQFGDFSFAHPEDDHLATYHQLDLSFVYKPSLSFMDAELRLDLINVLNRRNTIDWSLYPVGDTEDYKIHKRTMPGFNPSLSLQINF